MRRVGLTADWEAGPSDLRLVLNRAYAGWLREAGLHPVVLPSLPGDEAGSLEGLSGLVLTGGGDIPPALYGGDPEPAPEERYSHPDRSAFEFALVWRAVRMGLPLLGICLGCQTLNVALGGSLVRHLEDPERWHRRKAPDAPSPRHRLHTRPGSLIHSLYRTRDVRVLSSHHQAIGLLAEGFEATAWGPGGVVEAIESAARPNVLGVQWHPERTPRSLFSRSIARWFRDRAEAWASGRR
ncbi:MAG: gamma-glutamyl-gamma-aminobutyrate hydrolase family protein [Acidobacteriota bacterium]